mgnify:CR=1 FL=1
MAVFMSQLYRFCKNIKMAQFLFIDYVLLQHGATLRNTVQQKQGEIKEKS